VKAHLVSFGTIEVAGRTYEHDVLIDRGHVRNCGKKPSKARRGACQALADAPDTDVCAILHVTC
jgi:hypothetical protein